MPRVRVVATGLIAGGTVGILLMVLALILWGDEARNGAHAGMSLAGTAFLFGGMLLITNPE